LDLIIKLKLKHQLNHFKITTMNKKQLIEQEAIRVYNAIVEVMQHSKTDYCRSWWLNTMNLNIALSTSKITQRCRLLAAKGYLTIDYSKTSTSTGTCYFLTDKKLESQSL